MEKKEELNKENAFTGLCLMSAGEFEIGHILLNLRQKWGIKVNADLEYYEENENSVSFAIDDMNCFINFIDRKISEEEINIKAGFNYMFENAKEICNEHINHIAIGVIGGRSIINSAMLFTKIATACLEQYNAIALYTTFNVMEATAYINEAEYIKRDFLPIENWIYIGFKKNDDKSQSVYTMGMKNFLKDEMEILNSYEDSTVLRNRLLNIAYFLIDTDTELSEDETLTLNEQTKDGNKIALKFKIKYDEAVNGTGKTVKIEQ